MKPRVTVVITQRETFSRSGESLRSVFNETSVPFELVYVDGASPPLIRDELRAMAGKYRFRLMREEQILPPNEAKCLAIPFIQTEFSVFLDNDVLVVGDWLSALLRCAEETGAGAVAPMYLERMGSVEKLHMLGGLCRIDQKGDHRQLIVSHDQRKGELPAEALSRMRTEHIEMHALLVRSRLLREYSLFDPAIRTIPENIDFCLSLLSAGEQIWMEPNARVVVLLPESIHQTDTGFFTTRWSDDWIDRSYEHFSRKWQLTGPQPVLKSQRRWAVAHRGIAYPNALHRRLGVKSDSNFNRYVLAPLERSWFNY